MGGLQGKLMNRAKGIQGTAVIYLNTKNRSDSKVGNEVFRIIQKDKRLKYSVEYEGELLLKYKSFLTPVVVHGIDLDSYLPVALQGVRDEGAGIVLPMDLAYKVGVLEGDEVSLISPIHVDTFLTDVPRQMTSFIQETVSFDVPEVDGFHLWIKLSKIQNLIREKKINVIRFYSKVDHDLINELKPFGIFQTWETANQSLVFALNLESTVMIFLFGAMSLLVSFCISSGLLIFFNKIRLDLSSFWILGMSPKEMIRATSLFLYLMIVVSILCGLGFGSLFLVMLKTYGREILPDVFIDRKLPVDFSLKNYVISFLVPFFVSLIFKKMALKKFKAMQNHLSMVRSIGS